MKTAISIPDPLFNAAEKQAKHLGMSRSQFYATAVAQLLDSLNEEMITKALNEIYTATECTVDPLLAQMQLSSLAQEDWE